MDLVFAAICLAPLVFACGSGTSTAKDSGVNETAGDHTGTAGSAVAAAGSGNAGSDPGTNGGRAGRSGSPAAGSGAAGAAGASGTGMTKPDAMVAPEDAGAMPEAGTAGTAANTACGHCGGYATPMQVGTVGPSDLDSLSGLAVSRSQPDIVFVHDDHDRAVVFALDLQGREHARMTLDGATASDLEDIAIGPCGAQSCVYLADIGDNAASRNEYGILRFVEPTVPSAPGNTAISPPFERFRFSYEDGSHNAESLMVAPDGTLYLVTKLAPGSGGKVMATGPSSVYKLPASITTSSVARATKVATLTVPASGELAASAAAAHPCGEGFLLRTYDRVYEFLVPSGGSFEAAFSVTPKVVAMPSEPQSEGIDYRADGRGFISSGEGAAAPILATGCAP
jgi:hypothetical protein